MLNNNTLKKQINRCVPDSIMKNKKLPNSIMEIKKFDFS